MNPIWSPPPERIADAHMTRFMRFARERHQAPLADYAALHRWSVEYPENFWSALWDFAEVRAERKADRVLVDGNKMPGAQWFVGAKLNFAANLLKLDDDSPAIIFRNERGVRRELSWRQLRTEVARIADGLRQAGVKEGDRVAGYLPNLPEAMIAMLATASLGAIWSSCSPDFGVSGVCDRFGQISPKVLIAADAYPYAGKTLDCLATVKSVKQTIASIERVVIVPYLSEKPAIADIPDAVLFPDFGSADAKLSFAQLPFAHPVYILYSSGTTGVPKCITHSGGGALLQHIKEHVLHSDLRTGDRYFYYTTCGWVMWNALAGALVAGATVVLFDGSPVQPDPRILWRMAAEEKLAFFGTSPRFLTACQQAGVRPGTEFDLSALRTIISTGAPLSPESVRYVYRDVKQDVQLASISGGTDILGAFALGCPLLPVYETEMQCLGLGMKVEVFDENGKPVVDTQGELVCSAPFPSVPIGFWSDTDGSRFHATYFARYPNVWWHGDFATVTSRGGLIVHGRSDAVLNPGGVRIGTAEIYRQVEKVSEVAESVAIAQSWQNDVRVVLFVRLLDGLTLTDELQRKIRDTIGRNTTPRHVPAKIIQAPDLPRTLNGKLTELAVREAVHGRPVRNTDALANPQVLEFFRDLPELQR
ncbi:acetoacetyl-CoA synthetase [Povalibacter uvarum]|uniref:Acetoacetyl-CoA synthetase n=1 Tax=Povalibacter uvarum TaxID=732238 RepID=A0A841HNG7_9GAMM|nr:acetoacetate--CoA ligase [Povalibacter uvarum]MBB6094416.1 acetoacetyl-CoA synthetase [Povalibacter uvarum]